MEAPEADANLAGEFITVSRSRAADETVFFASVYVVKLHLGVGVPVPVHSEGHVPADAAKNAFIIEIQIRALANDLPRAPAAQRNG